jgi:putative spermidine/putrescine transport system substrate-binding protein
MTRIIRRGLRLTAGVAVAGLVASACSLGNAAPPPAGSITADNIYKGLNGQELVFNSGGGSGAFNAALKASLIANFEKKTGMTVRFDSFCCGISKLGAMVDSGNVTWTVGGFSTTTDAKLAEANDLLLKLDRSVIPLDKLADNTYDDYTYQAWDYAAGVVWNTDAFPLSSKHPTKLEDVFNTADFPGKRCLFKYPQFGGTLEAAALASGVSPQTLYPLDVMRALRELDKIKSDTIFWSDSAIAVQAILTGNCKIGILWNGVAYSTIRENPGAKMGFAFGHAIWIPSELYIPKGTKNLKAAEAFLRWIIEDTAGQTQMLNATAYLTVLLKTPLAIPDKLKPYALAGDNLKISIQEDDIWYGRNIDAAVKAFNNWLVT